MPAVLLGRGGPEDAGAIGNVAMKPGARPDERPLSDSQMTRRARLGHHDCATTDDRSAGKSSLRHDQGVLSHITVMSDLDQIIDLGTTPDPSLVQGRAIDGRIRADFDIILDDDATALSHCDGATGCVRHITKSVGAEHDARMQNDAISNTGFVAQDRAGVDPAISAEFDIHSECDVRLDDAARPHATAGSDDRARSDRCSRVDDGRRVDVCADRDAHRRTKGWRKFSNQSGEIMSRMQAAKGRSTADCDTRRHDHGAGFTGRKRRCVGRVAQENQLISLGLTERGEARDLEVRVALDRASEQRRQLGQLDRPERSRHDLASEQHGHGRGPYYGRSITSEEILRNAVTSIRTHHDQTRAHLLGGVDDLHVGPTECRRSFPDGNRESTDELPNFVETGNRPSLVLRVDEDMHRFVQSVCQRHRDLCRDARAGGSIEAEYERTGQRCTGRNNDGGLARLAENRVDGRPDQAAAITHARARPAHQ